MEQNIENIRKNLLDTEKRIEAIEMIVELGKNKQEVCQKLWNSDELIFAILQHITDFFYILNTEEQNEKVQEVKSCLDALAVISEAIDISTQFFKLQLDYYIYPFLMATTCPSLRISSLSLFFSLLSNGNHEKMKCSELLPLLLKIVDSEETECELLALGTLEHIINGPGLEYAVQTVDRFQAIDVVMNSFFKKSILNKNLEYLPGLLRIYTRLCEKSNVKVKLREKLPEMLECKEMVEICAKNEGIAKLRNKLVFMFN